MGKKEMYNLIIGGDFQTQPKHKPRIVPLDFLAQFRNVKSNKVESIINFANHYSFGGYLCPDRENSINDRFRKIQNKYNPIIDGLVTKGVISYADILTINRDLKDTAPAISLQDKLNDLQNIEESFAVYLLTNIGDEKPDYEVQHIGSFDLDQKAAHIKVMQKVPDGSKSRWYHQRVRDGVTKVTEMFPSEKWEIEKKYLTSVVLENGSVKIENGQAVSIEMNFRIGKTDFKKEELMAVWSPTTGESFIAKRVWDHINTEYKGTKLKQCKICGDLHTGFSPNHCPKDECRKEWDSKRKTLKNK